MFSKLHAVCRHVVEGCCLRHFLASPVSRCILAVCPFSHILIHVTVCLWISFLVWGVGSIPPGWSCLAWPLEDEMCPALCAGVWALWCSLGTLIRQSGRQVGLGSTTRGKPLCLKLPKPLCVKTISRYISVANVGPLSDYWLYNWSCLYKRSIRTKVGFQRHLVELASKDEVYICRWFPASAAS